uniref:X-ray repair cross complementing 2 n=1 Tax=Rousettus aegyptiacus TaxID=9407 RepID=A0A7J8D969_ROUAE|nr:X-ray repair cross complementing 2 [Rousettus aegyptiacus]
MCSELHRAESGTQLLVRLEGRSSLKEIEPCLFADEDSPVHGGEVHLPEVSMGILPRSWGHAKFATKASDMTVLRKVLSQCARRNNDEESRHMSKCCLGRACASAPILETWIGAEKAEIG